MAYQAMIPVSLARDTDTLRTRRSLVPTDRTASSRSSNASPSMRTPPTGASTLGRSPSPGTGSPRRPVTQTATCTSMPASLASWSPLHGVSPGWAARTNRAPGSPRSVTGRVTQMFSA